MFFHYDAWTFVGIAAAALTSFSFVPQIRKMWRRRSAGDVSQVTFFQMMAGNALWLLYGIFRRDAVIIGSNSIAIVIIIIGLFIYFRFREKKARGVIYGTMLGAQELGADPLVAVRDSSRGLVKAAAEAGQDVAAVARAVAEEALEATKAASIDVNPQEAVSATVAGIVDAADDMGGRTGRAVREAAADIISESAGDTEGPAPA